MAIRIPQSEQDKILSLLSRDKAEKFNLLEGYLLDIGAKKDIAFPITPQETITLPYQEAWELIFEWARSAEGGLSVGDRLPSAKVGASKLLSYIRESILGVEQETAAAYYSMLEQAKYSIPPTSKDAPPRDKAFDAAMGYLRRQLDAHNASVLGLASEFEQKSAWLQNFDPRTRRLLSLVLAANGDQIAHFGPQTHNRIATTLLHLSGYTPSDGELSSYPQEERDKLRGVNAALKLLYSTPAESNSAELGGEKGQIEELSSLAKDYIDKVPSFTPDLKAIRTAALLSPTSSNLDRALTSLAPNLSPQALAALSASIRSAVVKSAHGQHVRGEDIISETLSQAGIESSSLPPYFHLALTPLIDQLEIKIRSEQIKTNLPTSNETLLLSTWGVAETLGVNPKIPWYTPQSLIKISDQLVPGSGKNINLLDQAYLDAVSSNDIPLAGQIQSILHTRLEYQRYVQGITSNPLLGLRELVGKITGNYRTAASPVETFTSKLWGKYLQLEEVVTWPARKLTDFVEKIVDRAVLKIPLGKGKNFYLHYLALPTQIYNGWVNLQKGITLRVFRGTANLARKGRWYSGFFRQIADFSKAFYKADANWNLAGFNFFSKKWGNFSLKALDWTARKLGATNFAALKTSIGQTIKAVGMKIAPGMTSKLVTLLGSASSTLGVGFLILGAQVLFDVGKRFFGRVGGFFKKIFGGKADSLTSTTTLALGSALVVLNTLLAGIPMMIYLGIEITRSLLKRAWDLLVFTFILAATVAIILVATTAILFYVFKTTLTLDSGVGQQIVSILCDEDAGNSEVAAAACIVQILSECSLNPLTSSNANTPAWQCALAGLVAADAMEILKDSATSYTYVQCVGFVRAVDVATGGSGAGWGDAKTLDDSPPGGYTFVSGVGSCSPGDVFVDNNGDFGHTGIFLEHNGPIIKCMDANGGGPGLVRGADSCTWLSSNVVGCLKKI